MDRFNTTSFNGITIKGTYAEICERFGMPNSCASSDGKVQCEWLLSTDDGTPFTIYDWKEYGVDVKGGTTIYWHVGNHPNDTDKVRAYVEKTQQKKKITATEVKELHTKMCDALREYKNAITRYLKEQGGEFKMDNGYGEDDEPLILNVVDDDCSGVDTFAIDKARCGKDGVEFHIVSRNYEEQDYWMEGYYLGSDESYALENIII